MNRHNRDPDQVVAETITRWLFTLLGWGLMGLFHWFREASIPVYPGVTLGYRRTGLQKPVTLPWQTFSHLRCTGATGSGKSTLLLNIAAQYLQAGYGLTVISPKADLIEDLLPHIPAERIHDTILFDATDNTRPPTFNVLDEIDPQLRSRAASEVLIIFKRFYADSWGPRLEHILRFALLALLECPNTTLASIPPLLLDDAFRQHVLSHVTNPMVTQFWEMEYAALSPGLRAQAIQPLLNKVASLLAYPQVHHILAHPRSSFRLQEILDQGRILLVNLPQGVLGEDVSAFLGGLLISKIQLAAMRRASLPPEQRRRHVLIIDEFQNYGGSHTTTDVTFTKIFTEARAFNLALCCAHQFDSQLSRGLLDAIEHNVGVSLTCQVEHGMHTLLYRQPQDPSQTEQVLTPLPPLGAGNSDLARRIIQNSRLRYGRPLRQLGQAVGHRTHRRTHAQQPNPVAFFRAP